MKIIKTSSFNKLSKEWDPNPWAVCTDSVGRKDSEKYERCVQKVKEQDETKSAKKPTKWPKNNRGTWDPEEDFTNRLNDEFSGYNDDKAESINDDKWKMLLKRHKKEQPVFAKNIGIIRAGDHERRKKEAQHEIDINRYETEGGIGESEFENDWKINEGPQYVSVYRVERAYGGPEEGGWWYDVYSLIDTKRVETREAGIAIKSFLENKYKIQNQETGPLDSSRGFETLPEGTEDYQIPRGFSGDASEIVVILEDEPGKNTTTEIPHYE